MSRIIASTCLLTAAGVSGLLLAEEGAAAAPASAWSHKADVSLHVSTLFNDNEETSRDPTISSSLEHYGYVASFDGKLTWSDDPQEVEQILKLEFGRRKDADESWEDSHDTIDYDGTYRYAVSEHNRWYGAWGIDSVFTGAEPEEHELDPTIAKVSGGFAQVYKQLLENDVNQSFEWRAGVRAQRRFGHGIGDEGREIETGIEGFGRWTRDLKDQFAIFAQGEAFSEFEDLGHITLLLTAGLTYKFNKYLNLKMGLRAYYETEPEEAGAGAEGFDEWSFMQDTMLGVTYSF